MVRLATNGDSAQPIRADLQRMTPVKLRRGRLTQRASLHSGGTTLRFHAPTTTSHRSLASIVNRIVYDSDFGRTNCEVCQRPVARCKCPQLPPSAQASGSRDGIVRMRREVRRGKPTTVIVGLPLSDVELRDLAATLKRKCGSGGSAKDGQIEIQGDHRSLLQSELEARGYRVKLAGG